MTTKTKSRKLAVTLAAPLTLALSFPLLLALPACGMRDSSAPAKTPAETSPGSSSVEAALRTSLAGPQRTEQERARDKYRHPLETLEFFGLREDMNVVELSPGQGWFSAVLAPVVKDKGKLTVTTAPPDGPPDSEATKNTKALLDRFAKDPSSFGKVSTVVVDWGPKMSLGPDGSADLVVTFRNLHGWIRNGQLPDVLAAAFRVLKPGGVLGVEQHRAAPGASTDPKAIADSGYVPEAYAIELAEKAGFKLAGKSEINANPRDTRDYAKGVWTLPPTLRLGDVDKDKYLAIGESDRMTLKFVKP